MRFGYARISTNAQDLARQMDALNAAGVDRVFQDTITGVKYGEALLQLLDQLREGDEIIVAELSRLGRNMAGLIETMERINEKGCKVHSIKEGWISTNDAMSKMFFYLLGMFAEMERDYIRERTRRGLEAARARGRIGGRPRLPAEKTKKALTLYSEGRLNVEEIVKVTGVSRSTLYRYINEKK